MIFDVIFLNIYISLAFFVFVKLLPTDGPSKTCLGLPLIGVGSHLYIYIS